MKSKIIGVYLAAGKSKRYNNGNKLLAPFNHVPLGSIGLLKAIDSFLDEVIVVVRPNDPLNWITNEINNKKERFIIKKCKESFKGISNSLKCGLLEAEKKHAKAVMVILADQPFITTEIINMLIGKYQQNNEYTFVGMSFNGIISPPILLSNSIFPKIYQLKGDIGANKILQNEKNRGFLYKLKNMDLLLDIDTIEDYSKLKNLYEKT